jgi:hypothetical protein
MFFLIRCVFWLTIVFHAMSWPPETWSVAAWSHPQPQQNTSSQDSALKVASDAAANLTAEAGTAFAAKLEEGCLKAPAECLAIAARLPQIVAITQSGQAVAVQPNASQAIASHTINVLPPKRPTHLAENDERRPSQAHKGPVQDN